MCFRSQIPGIILSGNEISQILLSLVLAYYGGQRDRPRWIAWGIFFSALSCFILASPHFMFGAGDDAFRLTDQYKALFQVRSMLNCLPHSIALTSIHNIILSLFYIECLV